MSPWLYQEEGDDLITSNLHMHINFCCCLLTKFCLILLQAYGIRPPGSVKFYRQEWSGLPFTSPGARPRDQTHVSCNGRQILYHSAT